MQPPAFWLTIVDCNVIFDFSLAANTHTNYVLKGEPQRLTTVHRRVGSMVTVQEQAIDRDGQLAVGGIEVAQ